MQSVASKLTGAVCYTFLACLHLKGGYNVYLVGSQLDPKTVKGCVFPDAWNLLFFGPTAIGVALTLNIRSNKWSYWINLRITGLAGIGLIFFVLIPSHWSWWPSLAGPILWLLGLAFVILAYFHTARLWHLHDRRGHDQMRCEGRNSCAG